MTESQVADLGPALTDFLQTFTGCFFRCYCRGLFSDLLRKSVEPMALAAGTMRSPMVLPVHGLRNRHRAEKFRASYARRIVNDPLCRISVYVVDERFFP